MSYSQGGLIEATDYNNLINGSNQLNTVWGVGNGDAGYGQTAISAVAVSNTVTATQWATLINRLNSVLIHQSGSGSGISAVTAGQTISYLSALQTQVNTAYTNRANFATQGSTLTGTNDATNPTAAATSALSYFRDVNVTFASADAARYFFNAGGQINFVCSATDNAATPRSTALRDMVNEVGGLSAFRNTTNGGRTGTGGTIVVNDTTIGYRDLVFGSPTTVVDNNIAGAYSAHDVKLAVFSGANDPGSNGAITSSIVFRLSLSAAADDALGGAINLTLNVRADIVFPETVNLTDVWGTPTITFDSA